MITIKLFSFLSASVIKIRSFSLLFYSIKSKEFFPLNPVTTPREFILPGEKKEEELWFTMRLFVKKNWFLGALF